MQERTRELRQKLQKEIRQEEQQEDTQEQVLTQLQILEDYTATVEGAIHLEGMSPFHYGGLQVAEALTTIQTSLTQLKKGGAR